MSEKDSQAIRSVNEDLRRFTVAAQAMHVGAERAAQALRAFGQAAAKAAMPRLHAIAKVRLDRLAIEHGSYRFIMPEYWRWRRLALNTDDAQA